MAEQSLPTGGERLLRVEGEDRRTGMSFSVLCPGSVMRWVSRPVEHVQQNLGPDTKMQFPSMIIG